MGLPNMKAKCIPSDPENRAPQEIFMGYPGKSPVKVQFDRKLYPMNVTVDATNSLKAEVSSVIGENNIKII